MLRARKQDAVSSTIDFIKLLAADELGKHVDRIIQY